MARIVVEVGETFIFKTEIPVRISDINSGHHVGNDAFVSLIHEARVRFFESLGYTEANIEGKALIISDLAVIYNSQSFYGDVLKFEINLTDFNKYGCDILYRCSHSKTNVLVLTAKTGIVFYDYTKKKVISIPDAFKLKLNRKLGTCF